MFEEIFQKIDQPFCDEMLTVMAEHFAKCETCRSRVTQIDKLVDSMFLIKKFVYQYTNNKPFSKFILEKVPPCPQPKQQ